MALEDKHAWCIVLIAFAMLVVFIEPYYAKQTLSNFIIAMSYFGFLGLTAIIMILYGIYLFFTAGKSIHIQIGVMLLIFIALMSQLPIL